MLVAVARFISKLKGSSQGFKRLLRGHEKGHQEHCKYILYYFIKTINHKNDKHQPKDPFQEF